MRQILFTVIWLIFLDVIGMQTIIEKKQSEFEMDVCIRTYSVARESQTSTEMEQSGIEVGVRAMKKKRGARCLQQTDSSFYPPIDFKDFPLYTHVVSLPGTIVTI